MPCSGAVARDFMKNFETSLNNVVGDGEKSPVQSFELFQEHGVKNGDAVDLGCSSSKTKLKPDQLTIFYMGAVSVFDCVSIDKARAILFLAGETSTVTNVTQLQTNLPIASKRSLKQFFDKRRDRIMNRSPYRVPSKEDESSA